MNQGFLYRGVLLGTRAHESTFDGKTTTKWYLGVSSSAQNSYGVDDTKTVEFRVENNNQAQLLNYFNSLKGKLVEVSFQNRPYELENGKKGSNMFVTGVVECKPESKG